MDLQKAREKFAEINLKHGFYTQEELEFTDLGVFECAAAEQDFDMWWECLIYCAQPLIDQKEKALLEQFEINNKLVEQIEKLKAQAVLEVKPSRSVTLTCAQLREAFMFGAPDKDDQEQLETEMTIAWSKNGHSGKGYYCYYSDLPEEGAIFLDDVIEAQEQSRD